MLHSFNNVLVTGAAANIALQKLADFAFGGLGFVFAQVYRAHHHPGGAIAALQAVALFKCRLHRVHGSVCRSQPFNGGDFRSAMLDRQGIARLDSPAVDDDGASSALRGIAAHVGTSEFEVLAQRLHQQRVGRDVEAGRFAVDFELNLHEFFLHRVVVKGRIAQALLKPRQTRALGKTLVG